MKIGIITIRQQPARVSPVMGQVAQLLAEWGATVELIYPEERLTDMAEVRVGHDLYILKSSSELALSFAGSLHAVGAQILNPYPVAMTMRDKIVATRILLAAGVPVPETYVTAQPRQLAPLLDAGALVVKPNRGSQGRGVHIVCDPDELDNVATAHGLIFAQRHRQPEGPDRKIYCVGGHTFGVMRKWPARTYQEKVGESFTVTPELHEIAMRCGRAFGVELYGIDVVLSEGRPYVVDINPFPGFKGVPDAALRLADYIYTAAQRALAGEPLFGRVGLQLIRQEVAA